MKKIAVAICGLSFSLGAQAADTISLGGATLTPANAQSTFATIVGDMGGAFNYKALNPAEPQGLVGFDVSINATYAEVSDEAAWQAATGEDIEQIGSIGVKLSKGLLLGLDASAFYNVVPGTDASFMGAALSYAIEEGGLITPAVAIRAGVTRGQGIEDFDFDTKSLDLTVSKGFAMLTPYAGIGRVRITGTPTSTRAKTTLMLQEEEQDETRKFVGLKFNLGFQLVAEYEDLDGFDSFSLRLGFGL